MSGKSLHSKSCKKGIDKKLEKILFKYNEDDILEILTEYLAEKNGFGTFSSRAMLLGTPNKDLRVIAVVGEIEDTSIGNLDLEDIDKEMSFNGTHKYDYYSDTNSLLKSLDKAIKKG